jgi:hypothetical protein
MSGFPTRFLRSALGPIFRDVRPVENPERELSADAGNLIANVATAANLLLPRAVLIGDTTTTALVILQQEEAWNVDRAQAQPTAARSSAGVITYTFASQYLDKDGTLTALTINGARATAITLAGSTAIEATVDLTSAYVVTVRLNAISGGAATDGRFWLEVF